MDINEHCIEILGESKGCGQMTGRELDVETMLLYKVVNGKQK